jgi:hypothetical protein
LDRCCHFKHVSLKQNRFNYCQNEHGSQVKDQGRRQCCHNRHKYFPYRSTRDLALLSGHASWFSTLSHTRHDFREKVFEYKMCARCCL